MFKAVSVISTANCQASDVPLTYASFCFPTLSSDLPLFIPEQTKKVRPTVLHNLTLPSSRASRRCLNCASLIAEKVVGAGRHDRQIELCERHCEIVIERERARGLEICDRRDE
jgi:hypothetical protein